MTLVVTSAESAGVPEKEQGLNRTAEKMSQVLLSKVFEWVLV